MNHINRENVRLAMIPDNCRFALPKKRTVGPSDADTVATE